MKSVVIAIIIAIILIFGAMFFKKNENSIDQENINNVSIVNDQQIITINAKGGYIPKVSSAKAGMPTLLRFNTKGTFDCSASVRIPSMNISQVLPNSGVTDINLGNQPIGVLQGTCGMGMYPFEINFQ